MMTMPIRSEKRRLEASAFRAIVKQEEKRPRSSSSEEEEEEETFIMMWLGCWVRPTMKEEDGNDDEGGKGGGAILDVAVRVPVTKAGGAAEMMQRRLRGCHAFAPVRLWLLPPFRWHEGMLHAAGGCALR